MKYIFGALLSFVLLPALASGWALYDATGFSEKPDLSKYGLSAIWVAYEDKILTSGSDADLHAKFAQAAVAHPSMPWVLDVESLPIISNGAVNKVNVLRLLHVLQIAKSEAKGWPVSYFAILPANTNVFNADPNIVALSAAMDFFAPSLYMTAGWTNDFWANNLVLGAKIGTQSLDPKKPVYPFIWMYQNNNNNILLTPTSWSFILDMIKKDFNGAVLWGGYDLMAVHPLSTPLKWNDSAEWWGIIKNFYFSPTSPTNVYVQ